jgi:hypothetical protein
MKQIPNDATKARRVGRIENMVRMIAERAGRRNRSG